MRKYIDRLETTKNIPNLEPFIQHCFAQASKSVGHSGAAHKQVRVMHD